MKKTNRLSDLPSLLEGQVFDIPILDCEIASEGGKSSYLENLKQNSSELRKRFVDGVVREPKRMPYEKENKLIKSDNPEPESWIKQFLNHPDDFETSKMSGIVDEVSEFNPEQFKFMKNRCKRPLPEDHTDLENDRLSHG